ncbi:hypothetical protein [Glaciihabitans sp. dw_435]|uniref:hypothetical protein n=1 Tax=Glaciihabitans sp. dw_435 TaxID=2720081 RepID=UPI001BD25161|nr:hypothetical protein [Glaciihabitans sp. dw_435]
MPTSRFQLRGANLDDLKTQILAEHGSAARIISAERVTQGGIGKFLAKQFFEVTVEVAEARLLSAARSSGPAPGHAGPELLGTAERLGIAALLAEADAADDVAPEAPQQHLLSTTSADFEEILADLAARAGIGEPDSVPSTPADDAPPAARAPASPRTGGALELSDPGLISSYATPGDLVLFVGLGQDALTVARAMSRSGRHSDLRSGGGISLRGSAPITDRRAALTARAEAVIRKRWVFVAFGLDDTEVYADLLRAIGADQVWAVVDAGRKPDDTERWVLGLGDAVGVDALAVVGAHRTTTPETVARLGVPIGWIEAPVQ